MNVLFLTTSATYAKYPEVKHISGSQNAISQCQRERQKCAVRFRNVKFVILSFHLTMIDFRWRGSTFLHWRNMKFKLEDRSECLPSVYTTVSFSRHGSLATAPREPTPVSIFSSWPNCLRLRFQTAVTLQTRILEILIRDQKRAISFGLLEGQR